jgi:hypothetical protein
MQRNFHCNLCPGAMPQIGPADGRRQPDSAPWDRYRTGQQMIFRRQSQTHPLVIGKG